MIAAIKYNLANLTTLAGRDRRQTFWFYVLFLVLVQFGVSLAISLPLTGAMMGDVFNGVVQGASEGEMHQRVFARVGTMMTISVWTSVVLSLLTSALLAAAFTRRLHDSGKTGWIAAATFGIKLIALVMAITTIDDAVRMVVLAQSGDLQTMQGIQKQFAVQSLLGWVPTAIVVVFGVWPSTKGENRYGPEPLPS